MVDAVLLCRLQYCGDCKVLHALKLSEAFGHGLTYFRYPEASLALKCEVSNLAHYFLEDG